jgi:hypothetical protein
VSPRRILPLAAAALLLAACDDPVQVLSPPTVRGLSLYMILDPDQPVQPLVVKAMQSGELVTNGRADVLQGGAPVASVVLESRKEYDDFEPCIARYSSVAFSGGPPRCVSFGFAARHGATYAVSVTAAGRPPASATVTVPGPFQILSVSAQGSPPGTAGLQATWSRSEGVYRYVVAMRSDSLIACRIDPSCPEGNWDPQAWWVATTDTTIQVTVPVDRIRGGTRGWRMEVYAMEQHIFDFLSTGTVAEPFPVPPRQNVQGGYGAVGAWVRRSVPVGP